MNKKENGLIKKYSTPFYLYDISALSERIGAIREELPGVGVCFAMKAAPALTFYTKRYADRIEACSPGEYEIAMRAGTALEKIVYSGVNKHPEDVLRAIETSKGRCLFTIESRRHFEILDALSKRTETKLRCLLRLSSGNQFGVGEEEFFELCKCGFKEGQCIVKTISVEILDIQSVEHAVAELKEVRAEWIRKANRCCETIATMLADMITDNLLQIPYSDDLIDLSTHEETPGLPMIAAYAQGNSVFIKGEEVAFVEFGAGVYHAGNSNPLSDMVQFNTEIGSYGQGNGLKPYWFVAHNLISRGTPAYMPIWNAINDIKPQIPTIVRQIFV